MWEPNKNLASSLGSGKDLKNKERQREESRFHSLRSIVRQSGERTRKECRVRRERKRVQVEDEVGRWAEARRP